MMHYIAMFERDLSLFDQVSDLVQLRRLTKDLNIKYIDNGSNSQVMSLKIGPGPHQVVLKVAALDTVCEDGCKDCSGCDEWTFARNLNTLIKANQGPHFLYSYKMFTLPKQLKYLIVQDKADFNLEQANEKGSEIQGIKSKAVQVSLFVQLMIALLTLHSRQIAHRDVKAANIFLKVLPTPTKVTYVTDFGTFSLTLEGYWLYLGDFNVSYNFHPRHAKHGNLGERAAKLVGTTLYPIKTRFVGPKVLVLRWSTSPYSTYRIFLTAGMPLAKQMNVYDPLMYPPFEFIDDTVDACRTFVGGPRCLMSNQDHEGLDNLDPDLRKVLTELTFPQRSYRKGTFDVTKGYLCHAGLLLQQVWKALGMGEDDGPVGGLYNLKGLVQGSHDVLPELDLLSMDTDPLLRRVGL